LRRDLATTFLTEATVVLSYLLSFRLVAQDFGAQGFGEYALARRTLAVLLPLVAITTDLAVARYVAFAVAGDPGRARRYAPAAGAIVLVTALALGAVLLLFPGPLAALLFGSTRYSDLILPMPLLIFGSALHGIAYGYLRGLGRIQVANVLMGLNHAVLPLVAIELSRGSVANILLLLGAGWAAVSLACLAVLPLSFAAIPENIRELVRYGAPRVPGDLLRFALFSAPSVVVAHLEGLTAAGAVAFGVAAVGMLGTAVSPIGFVMLPFAARMMAGGELGELRHRLVTIAALTGGAVLAAVLVVEVFAPQLVDAYLGHGFAAAARALRILIPAALPWAIYTSLASVVDAHHVRPVNARNMAIASAAFVVAMVTSIVIHPSEETVSLAFVVSLYVLGALTLLEVHSITKASDPATPVAVPSQPML
jgi:O-antigen/teichoic acid export membrane protein